MFRSAWGPGNRAYKVSGHTDRQTPVHAQAIRSRGVGIPGFMDPVESGRRLLGGDSLCGFDLPSGRSRLEAPRRLIRVLPDPAGGVGELNATAVQDLRACDSARNHDESGPAGMRAAAGCRDAPNRTGGAVRHDAIVFPLRAA